MLVRRFNFLHVLKCQTDRVAEILFDYLEKHSAQSNTTADMNVNRIGSFSFGIDSGCESP
jgi:hypothetical protein